MRFTGERYVPELDDPEISLEHWHRYLVAGQLASGRRVLDVACGEGYGSYHLALTAASVVGVDIDEAAISHASSTYMRHNLGFRVGSVTQLPVPPSSVDLVVCFETIEHVPAEDYPAFFREVRRVLAPQGAVLISTPNKAVYSDKRGIHNTFHVSEMYPAQFRSVLAEHFSSVRFFGQRLYPMGYLWPLDDPMTGVTEEGVTWTEAGYRPSHEPKEAVYVVGFCTNSSDPAHLGGSLLVDLSEAMLRRNVNVRAMQSRLQELERQRGAASSGASAPDLEQLRSELARAMEQLALARQEQQREVEGLRGQLASITSGDVDARAAADIEAVRRELERERRERAAADVKWSSDLAAVHASRDQLADVLETERRERAAAIMVTHSELEAVQASRDRLADRLAASQLELQSLRRTRRQEQADFEARIAGLSTEVQLVRTKEAEALRASERLRHERALLQERLAEVESSAVWRLGLRWIRFRQTRIDRIPLLRRLFDGLHWRLIRGVRVAPKSDVPGSVAERPTDAGEWQFSPIVLPAIAGEQPLISVLVPSFNRGRDLHDCLRSVVGTTEGLPVEVLVADDASSAADVHRLLSDGLENIRVLRRDYNVGYIHNCNDAARSARGRYLVFLNQDTIVEPGWLSALLRAMDRDATTAAVGAKLVYPDRRLQEAGGILWQDMTAANYGRGDDASRWEYNYLREVDYCSGACLMVRADVFWELGGFSSDLAPAYCDDSDFAMKARAAGYKVVYQPAAVVVHKEGTSMGVDVGEGLKRFQEINRHKLLEKWRATLQRDHLPPDTPPARARERNGRPRILFIDHYVPMWDRDSGSARMYAYIRIWLQMGFKVTIWPANLNYVQPYTSELQELGCEVIYGSDAPTFEGYLAHAQDDIDLVYGCRSWIMKDFIHALARSRLQGRIIYDPHDLAFLRERRGAAVTGDRQLLRRADELERQEWQIMRLSDAIVAVSTAEAKLIGERWPQKRCVLLQSVYEVASSPDGCQARRDLLFLGGFAHAPNVDAVRWFVQHVLPIIRERLSDVELLVVGSNAGPEIQELEGAGVRVVGYVADMDPWFRRARVFVAPLRYGAGEKGKIANSLSHGLPVVTTSVGAEGMEIRHGAEVLVADGAEAFAAAVCELYEDRVLWERLAHNGLEYARAWHSQDAMRGRMTELFQALGVAGADREKVLSGLGRRDQS